MYKAWVNCCLSEFGDSSKINDLAEDLKDGIVLCKLIKLTTGKEISQSQFMVTMVFAIMLHLVKTLCISSTNNYV